MKKRSIRWIAVAAILGGAVASSPNSPVKADTFRPLPAAPVVLVTSDPASINPGVDDELLVTATVGLEATVDDLDTVTLCLYKPSGSALDPSDSTDIGVGDATCSGDGTDPSNTFLVTWTEQDSESNDPTEDGDFAITYPTGGGHTWSLGETTPSSVQTRSAASGLDSYGTFSDLHQGLEITFSFVPSESMLAGSDWVALVTATYKDSICNVGGAGLCSAQGVTISGSDDDTLVPVSYWSIVKTSAADNERLSYGFLLPGFTSDVEESTAMTYKANGISQLTIRGSHFAAVLPAQADQLDLVTTVNGEGVPDPASGEVYLGCRDAKNVALDTDATFIAVPFSATDPGAVVLGVDRNATSESAHTATIRCKLTYGGGALTALATYRNTVTLGVVVKPS